MRERLDITKSPLRITGEPIQVQVQPGWTVVGRYEGRAVPTLFGEGEQMECISRYEARQLIEAGAVTTIDV